MRQHCRNLSRIVGALEWPTASNFNKHHHVVRLFFHQHSQDCKVHKFPSLPLISAIGVVAMVLHISIAYIPEPSRASQLQVRLNDLKNHSATHTVHRAHSRAAAGG